MMQSSQRKNQKHFTEGGSAGIKGSQAASTKHHLHYTQERAGGQGRQQCPERDQCPAVSQPQCGIQHRRLGLREDAEGSRTSWPPGLGMRWGPMAGSGRGQKSFIRGSKKKELATRS